MKFVELCCKFLKIQFSFSLLREFQSIRYTYSRKCKFETEYLLASMFLSSTTGSHSTDCVSDMVLNMLNTDITEQRYIKRYRLPGMVSSQVWTWHAIMQNLTYPREVFGRETRESMIWIWHV